MGEFEQRRATGGNHALLEVDNLTKRYPGVVALDGVSCAFNAGEVHALVGENGAGKSTLIKALSGYLKPSSGCVRMDGAEHRALTPAQALELGIGTIYQDACLVGDLSVSENIFLSRDAQSYGRLQRSKLDAEARALLAGLGIELPVERLVCDLSTSQAQFCAIAKAMARDIRVLILDEPTAALNDAESERLFSIVERCKERGVAVIYITHRLREVFTIADRISVLRDGRLVASLTPAETSEAELVTLIAGRPISSAYPERTCEPAGEVMAVEHLSGAGVRDVSFSLRKGEILGVAGLMGSGRTELARLLFGAAAKSAGSVRLRGEEARIASPTQAVRRGVGYVPADRKRQGVLLERNVRENITLPTVQHLSRFAVVDGKSERRVADEFIDALRIKTPSRDQMLNNLSGGNQQKVALSKWLACSSDVLLLDEPTQGVDVGARHEIYATINALTEQGVSIIMLSSDTEELVGMADRILVMRDGAVEGRFERGGYDAEAIMACATGASSAAA